MRHRILIDASCILTALGSPNGGSAKLLNLLLKKKHRVFCSEISVDEARNHLRNVRSTRRKLILLLEKYINEIIEPPTKEEIVRCEGTFEDLDDLYLMATAKKINASLLVSLDKRHILSQSKIIKKPKILSPGELIKILL